MHKHKQQIVANNLATCENIGQPKPWIIEAYLFWLMFYFDTCNRVCECVPVALCVSVFGWIA